MASSAIEILSPAVSNMSISRRWLFRLMSAASLISSSVVRPMADTTTTTELPLW